MRWSEVVAEGAGGGGAGGGDAGDAGDAGVACFLLASACLLLPVALAVAIPVVGIALGLLAGAVALLTPGADFDAEVEAARGEEAVVMEVRGPGERLVFLGTRILLLDDQRRLRRPGARLESVPYAAVTAHGLERAAGGAGWVLTIRAGGGVERRRCVLDEQDARAADRLLAEAVGRAVRGRG